MVSPSIIATINNNDKTLPRSVYSLDWENKPNLFIGADTAKDDGIYSANFMDFVGDGVYKVTLQIENEGQAKKVKFPLAISGVMPPNWSMILSFYLL